jgi:chromosomal replication initiator protein
VSAELDHIWSRVQAELAAAVDEPTYRIWLEPLRAREFAQGRLVVEAPPQACRWLGERFGRVLHAAAASALDRDVAVELVPEHASSLAEPHAYTGARRGALPRAPKPSVGSGPSSGQPPGSFVTATPSPLNNPKLTFDQFVIGDCNRLAHAAALAVAEMPAEAYNPLFICGPPGVGKTHLLGSIASLLLSHSPELAVRYTTGEAFTNDFLHALSGQHTDTFKAHFRHLDVLLVDDVQFLERKTRTEEEFFHTFNSLYDAGRQIVLSSDRPPQNLQALEDRLRERFESGLVADIKPPDLSTRIAILRKRAQRDQLEIADDAILELIAVRVQDNVRALEGALIRVVAYASLRSRALTSSLAAEVLAGLYPATRASAKQRRLSVADINAAACDQFGLTLEELLSSSRTPRVAWPRQIAMYLARELTGESLPAIARQFGGRDHTTILYAWRRTASRIATDPACSEAVNSLRTRLQPDSVAGSRAQRDRDA